MSARPGRKSGSRPTARSTASSARSAPAGRLPGSRSRCASASPDVAIALADVPGAALYSYYTTGELKAEGSSITEGIGQGRVTANLEGFAADDSLLHPEDQESLEVTLRLLQDEGLALGLSSGVNVAGAIRLARELGPGQDHRHHAVRPGDPLSVAAVQPGIPALQGPRRRRTGSNSRQSLEPDLLCSGIARAIRDSAGGQ